MTLIDQDLQRFAAALADRGREISLKYFRSVYDVARKGDGTPVTTADLAIETALREMIENQYPDHGTYGEENDAERSDAEWLWVIDPIDGTKSFATGKPTFGCLIALLHHRQPILGIIDIGSGCDGDSFGICLIAASIFSNGIYRKESSF